jgi:hypothetical protein
MRKGERFFSLFCALVLFITAAAKIASCFFHPDSAHRRDIVFRFLSIRQVLSATAAIEIIVAWLLIDKRVSQKVRWLVFFWLNMCFVLYRLGPFIVMGKTKITCKCLGEFAFGEGTPIVQGTLLALLLLMLTGSLLYFLAAVRTEKLTLVNKAQL